MTVRAALVLLVGTICGLLMTPAQGWPACTGASPSWTSTADYTSVNQCVTNAAAGDTILVSGTATWTSTLTWTGRGVRLIGSTNTTITGSQTLLYWIPDASARTAHDTLTVNGFTLDGNNVSAAGVVRVYNTSASDHVNLIVANNTFRNVGGRALYLTGAVYGVASLNTFDRVAMLFWAGGLDATSWANQTQAYGVSDNFYVENNSVIFSSSMSGYTGWTQTGQGGRVVVRYNSWNYTNVADGDELWDAHGLQTGPTCEQYSTMVAEYYGNQISNATAMNKWMAHRGGWLLMFYNTFAGTFQPLPIHEAQLYCNSCQVTGSYNQKVENSYFWRNLSNGIESAATILNNNCLTDLIVENADFFNYTAAFTGASGVGCGTLAARPATCTTGAGYWATDQSCSVLSGMVGQYPSTAISGTLYLCTATNTWTSYYTPYTFPHPLTPVPDAPQEITIK